MSENKDNNLLAALHKWAWRQDENFVSEAFAHLLRHLRDNEPHDFVELLSYLTDGRLKVVEGEAGFVEITTQVAKDEGRPDLQVGTLDHLVYVEVKVESGLGWKQLIRYRDALNNERVLNKTLVLLSRYDVSPDDSMGKPDVSRRWYRVADMLRGMLGPTAWRESLSGFFVRQFVDFLEARGMTMEKVTWELKNGVKAVWNLMGMVNEALLSQNAKPSSSIGKDFAGYGVNERAAWVGVTWEEPEQLAFHTWEYPTLENGAEAIGYGEVRPYKWSNSKFAWYNILDLASEDVHFFARSRESQMQCIEEFVKKGLEGVAKLEATRQQ